MYLRNTSRNSFVYTKAVQKKNNSLAKPLKNNDKKIESFPIKPIKNIIPKDVNLQKIFLLMNKCSKFLFDNYSNYLNYNNQKNSERKEIMNKIKDYFINNNIEYKIFFKTIVLYDILIIQNKAKQLLTSIEDIVLGSLILSIKFNYVENKMFSIKKFLKFYEKKSYTLQHLFDIERKCLKIINYYLHYITPMCFLEFFLINGIIYNTDSIKSDNYYNIYSDVEKTLEKIMIESNNYLKYNFFYLACSVVCYCRKIFNLDKWPPSLKRIFGVDITDFDVEYKALLSVVEKNINKYEKKKDISTKGNNNVLLLDFQNQNNEDKLKYENSNFNLYNRNSNKNNGNCKNNIINININNFSVNSIYNTIYSNNSYSTNLKKNGNLNRLFYIRNNRYSSYNSNKKNLNIYSSHNDIKSSNPINCDDDNNNTIKNHDKVNSMGDYKLTKNLSELKIRKERMKLSSYISPIKNIDEENIENKNEDIKESKNKENTKKADDDLTLVTKEINKKIKIRNYNFTSRFKIHQESNSQNLENINLFNTSNKKKDKKITIFNKINADTKKTNANVVKIKKSFKLAINDDNNQNIEKKNDNKTVKNKSTINNKNLLNIYKNYIAKEENTKSSNKTLVNDKKSYECKNEKERKIKMNNLTSLKNGTNITINQFGTSRAQKVFRLNKNINKYSSTKGSTENLTISDLVTPKKTKLKNIIFKTASKEDSKNNSPHKNDNKTKYNNLIKYKLSVSSSLNKNKEVRRTVNGYYREKKSE